MELTRGSARWAQNGRRQACRTPKICTPGREDFNVIKCRAAVAYEFKKPLVVQEIEVAPPKAHEIRVKVCASGICHTDDHALSGGMASLNFPVVLGHEGAGIVESVGEGVFKKFSQEIIVGKNVGLMLDKTSRFSIKGKMIHHFMSTSTFTEYTVVDEFAICRIDKRAPLDQVCLIGCGFSTGYGTVLNTAKVQPRSSCVVFGLGGIGMSAVMACKVAGARQIIGVDINPTKFPKAKELGCTDCVNPKDCSKPIHEVITEMTDGGADYGFECVGKVDVVVRFRSY
ncbi:unnamed protein product [Ranitomeya imitator]|uniref:Alcohol dehydrogenase n=1 Tax=Ranitomeya imitator TaxID=111125 RepID=A0ABN9M4T4_9NEOB|nr:unnamed protein product [Ranitomeya imitator]